MDMDNKKTHTSGQWTELNLQELDLVFASGKKWNLNGYTLLSFLENGQWDPHLYSKAMSFSEWRGNPDSVYYGGAMRQVRTATTKMVSQTLRWGSGIGGKVLDSTSFGKTMGKNGHERLMRDYGGMAMKHLN